MIAAVIMQACRVKEMFARRHQGFGGSLDWLVTVRYFADFPLVGGPVVWTSLVVYASVLKACSSKSPERGLT